MLENLVQSYKALYEQFGYSPKSLGWDKGKQFLRFFQLSRDWDLSGSSILDVGCGFGDFTKYLDAVKAENYEYTGIDIVKEFIIEAQERYGKQCCCFINNSFLDHHFAQEFDYIVSSGAFNLSMDGLDGYENFYENLKKMMSLAKKAISVDFLSDKVDFRYDKNFYFSPAKILEIVYEFSRNVVLRNDFFPFEFSITVYKNDKFRKETTIFEEIEGSYGKRIGI